MWSDIMSSTVECSARRSIVCWYMIFGLLHIFATYSSWYLFTQLISFSLCSSSGCCIESIWWQHMRKKLFCSSASHRDLGLWSSEATAALPLLSEIQGNPKTPLHLPFLFLAKSCLSSVLPFMSSLNIIQKFSQLISILFSHRYYWSFLPENPCSPPTLFAQTSHLLIQ